MGSDQTGGSADRHQDIERQLVDAEIGLARELEELANVEARMGLETDSDHRLEQAAELETRAKGHVEQLRHELEEEERNSPGRPQAEG